MEPEFKIVICASRDWRKPHVIQEELEKIEIPEGHVAILIILCCNQHFENMFSSIGQNLKWKIKPVSSVSQNQLKISGPSLLTLKIIEMFKFDNPQVIFTFETQQPVMYNFNKYAFDYFYNYRGFAPFICLRKYKLAANSKLLFKEYRTEL